MPLEPILDAVLARGDLAHLALFLWASLASALAFRLLAEVAAATRRFDAFVHELASFNRRHEAAPVERREWRMASGE